MRLKIVEKDFIKEVYLDDEIIWSDNFSEGSCEDMIWDRVIQDVFEAGRKLGFSEGRKAFEYPRDALDL